MRPTLAQPSLARPRRRRPRGLSVIVAVLVASPMVGEPLTVSAEDTGPKGRGNVGKRQASEELVEGHGTGAIMVTWGSPIAGGNPSRGNVRSRRGRRMQTQSRMPIPGFPCLFPPILASSSLGRAIRPWCGALTRWGVSERAVVKSTAPENPNPTSGQGSGPTQSEGSRYGLLQSRGTPGDVSGLSLSWTVGQADPFHGERMEGRRGTSQAPPHAGPA